MAVRLFLPERVCASLFAAHWASLFLAVIYRREICCAGMQFFRGEALLHDHIYLYLGAAVKKKTPILFFDTALKVLLPRGGWVCLSKGFCGFFEGFAKLIITKIFSVITSIHFGCFGSGFQTLCKNISKQKSCQQGRF